VHTKNCSQDGVFYKLRVVNLITGTDCGGINSSKFFIIYYFSQINLTNIMGRRKIKKLGEKNGKKI